MQTPTIFKTDFIGVYVQQEFAAFWLVSDNGCCDFVGSNYPTNEAIAAFADAARS